MGAPALSQQDALKLRECLEGDGVAVVPTDTVYGLACDPLSSTAVERLYELKGRPAERPAAVMFFALASAQRALAELQPRERAAMQALLPGAVTLLLPNRERRFPLACAGDPRTLGLRVPLLGASIAALSGLDAALMQSSANRSGQPAVRCLDELTEELLGGADLVLDVGELPGTASTVLDLRSYEQRGEWSVVRQGALSTAEAERLLLAS